jgi:S-formylglutathione hydrolase FrmB
VIVVHSMRADGAFSTGHQQPQYFYYACTDCGWVAPLRREKLAAVVDGQKHQQVKAATRDEQR